MPFTTMGTIWGELTQDQKEEVLKQVGEEAALRFKVYKETLIEGTGLPTLRGTKRLEHYRNRNEEAWARLEAEFPKLYDEENKDWDKLETNEARKLPKIDNLTMDDVLNKAVQNLPVEY